ncbi:MAG TPA: hypothetical protein VF487_15770 [Chitinophagaceae bacterium]
MRKYLPFLFVLLSINGLSQTPTAGQLKITIASFKCINKSWDGVIEFDGHGNEVFISYGYRIYNPAAPGSARPGAGYTPVFGSTGDGRVKAGTANAIGGIDNGNEIQVNSVIVNEHIDADQVILLSPSVWEWDNFNNGDWDMFNRQLGDDLNWTMLQPYPFANANINYNDPFNGRFIKMTDRYNGYFPITKYNFLKKLVNVQDNRPVGIKAGPFNGETLALYNPALLILDTRALAAFFHHNKSVSESTYRDRPSYISSFIDFTFTEETYGITTSNGSYSLKLKIEFTPDQQATPPTTTVTSAPPKYTKQPVVNTLSTQPVNTPLVNIAGRWTGTYGMGESSAPDFYSFQLNADGSMQVYSLKGGVVANGTYSFTNNVITGTYTYTNGTMFSFTGTAINNTMTGTWGNARSVSGGGKWVMTKN